MPTIEPTDLIGCTFLQDYRLRTKIIKLVDNNNKDLTNHKDKIKFRCYVNDDEYEDIVSYNDITNHIEKDKAKSVE